MRIAYVAIAALLLVAAAALPGEELARSLAGADSPRLAQVELGAAILRALLALHGVALLVLWRVRLAGTHGEPLLRPDAVARGEPSLIDNWIVAALLVVGGSLRRYDLGDQLWFDEIDTLVSYVRQPFGYVLTTFDSQNQHLLYSLAARTAFEFLGESFAALRLPAAIFGVASIWALWSFARLITHRREALFATALLTVSYHHVWFSQNARGYTGLLLFTLLGSQILVRMLTCARWNGFGLPMLYAACMALAVATHVTALFAIAAHGLIWLALAWSERRRASRASLWMPGLAFLLTATFSLALYALVLPQLGATMLAPSMPGAQTEWKSPLWLARETLAGLARGVPGGWVALAQGALIFGLGVWSYGRQSKAILALLVLGPILTAVAIVAMGHNLWPRFFFFGAGFMVLIVFRGLFALLGLVAVGPLKRWSPRLALAAASLLCVASAATVSRAYGPKQDFAGALEFVRANRAPEDAVATVEMTHLPYQEVYSAGWHRVDNIADLEALEGRHPRTWVVYTTPTFLRGKQPEIWQRLQQQYAVEKIFPGTVGGSEVVVCVRR